MVYSKRFLDKWVQKFLNKVFSPKLIVQTAEEKIKIKKKNKWPLFYLIWV